MTKVNNQQNPLDRVWHPVGWLRDLNMVNIFLLLLVVKVFALITFRFGIVMFDLFAKPSVTEKDRESFQTFLEFTEFQFFSSIKTYQLRLKRDIWGVPMFTAKSLKKKTVRL